MDSQEIYNRFPFFVDIHHWKILVVGAGTIASRRVGVLMDFGPDITVAAPEASEQILQLAETGKIRYRQQEFTGNMMDDENWNLVLAATNDSKLNHTLVKMARERRIPVNNASDQSECDFFFPAIVKGQGMILGMVSDGSDHGAVRRNAAKIREEYGEQKHD